MTNIWLWYTMQQLLDICPVHANTTSTQSQAGRTLTGDAVYLLVHPTLHLQHYHHLQGLFITPYSQQYGNCRMERARSCPNQMAI